MADNSRSAVTVIDGKTEIRSASFPRRFHPSVTSRNSFKKRGNAADFDSMTIIGLILGTNLVYEASADG